jgi:trk system potassium uptake protein TrkH
VFHSISAFCNAGFALFTDSLVSFASNPTVILVIAGLITAGGLSFAVMANGISTLSGWIASLLGTRERRSSLSVTGRAVLSVSLVLTVSGMFLFYAFEHGSSMAGMNTGTQYLTAFFQSVTLRTAGFNSLPLGSLATATYLVMMVWMFIGGASGSTAGGIKVNTVAVIAAYLTSLRKGRRETVLFSHTVRESQVAAAFTVLLFGVVAVVMSTIILSISETAPLTDILFESISAFATVGLSTGITGSLSTVGRFVIIILMFIGRVGPLTLFSALAGEPERLRVSYPRADLSVG